MQLHHPVITPAAAMREAERLRQMARRARACCDTVPHGMAREHYADRLERQALELIAARLGVTAH